ncbi:MAG: nucleoside/nucleotide kinase family protein [Paracoccus sp. (in: a-proteobacteria)]
MQRLCALAAADQRSFVALAGPPGSGKSTLTEALLAQVERDHPGRAAILPMDGFHYDDMYLEPRGLKPRKGAPQTFDAAGFGATLARLAADNAPVAVPVFDRDLEIARAGARVIGPETRLVLVEGNYLLLDDPDWQSLRQHFALTVQLDVPLDTLRHRLLERWRHLPQDEALRKVEANDLPNATLVLTRSVPGDLVLRDVALPGG